MMKELATIQAEIKYIAAESGVPVEQVNAVIRARFKFIVWLMFKFVILTSLCIVMLVNMTPDYQGALDPAFWSLLLCSVLCYIPMFLNLRIVTRNYATHADSER